MRVITLTTNAFSYEVDVRQVELIECIKDFAFDVFKVDYIELDDVDNGVIRIKLTDRDFSRVSFDMNYISGGTIFIKFGSSTRDEWEFDDIEVFSIGLN